MEADFELKLSEEVLAGISEKLSGLAISIKFLQKMMEVKKTNEMKEKQNFRTEQREFKSFKRRICRK